MKAEKTSLSLRTPIRRWFTFLPTTLRSSTANLSIPTTRTVTLVGIPEWALHGEPASHGAPRGGAATGAIAIGATAT
jgi:hypothetical protein